MGRLKPVKKTTFLEAVAAAIQHEKEVFEFYLRNAESLPESPVRHINMIRNLYEQIEGGELPNLKILAAVHNFHTTSLQILMRRLDRNTAQNAAGDELEAVSLATREHEDAAEFYNKMADKFEDPNIRNLFRRLANFQDENRMLLESYAAYSTQGSPQSQPGAYWEAEDLDA